MAQGLNFGYKNIVLVKSEENQLGVGSYGAVYKAKCDQLVCAAKILHHAFFQTGDRSARIVQRFQQEIHFLSSLRHPNIIQYLGSSEDCESHLPVLFMELMDESLTSFLERPINAPPLPLHVQVDIGHDVAQALSHLHGHEVLHRDLSSNNVLLIGSRRAKVTDFGMAKLFNDNLSLTRCPGTEVYMPPEALAEPPKYSSKLDIFSCGVLFVQLITRKFPSPGPRTRTIQLNDPNVPSGRALVEIPELERRKEHLDLISSTHPLLQVATYCLKDKETQRPSADQLCIQLLALKESAAYQTSIEQEMTLHTLPGHQQQHRRSESRIEELTRQLSQKDELDKEKELLLQGSETKLRKIQLREVGVQSITTESLKLSWRDGPDGPSASFGNTVAVSEEKFYCRNSGPSSKVLLFNSITRQWKEFPECPKKYFALAVFNGQLLAIGGENSNIVTNTLLSLPEGSQNIFQHQWIEQLPPMTHCRCDPAISTSKTSLIVAGGWGKGASKIAVVEILDILTLQWSTVSNLPYSLSNATATLCGNRLYLGGGFDVDGRPTNSVLMCVVKDLLQSQPHQSANQLVWKEIAKLPVVYYSLVTFQNTLLAVGGRATTSDTDITSAVRQYDASTNSWNVISYMRVKRRRLFAAPLQNKELMVFGGYTPEGGTNSVEIASLN